MHFVVMHAALTYVEFLQATAIARLLDCLELVSNHARMVNTDLALRRKLAAQQAEDRVPEDKAAGDPPLLRQETEAGHAYVSVLLHIYSVSSSSSSSMSGSSSSELKRLLDEVEQLCKVRAKGFGMLAHCLQFMLHGSKAPWGEAHVGKGTTGPPA